MSDAVAATEFLEALFAGADAGTHTILAAFYGDPYEKRRGIWAGRPWWPGLPLPEWYPGDGRIDLRRANCYLTVSTFNPVLPLQGKPLLRYRRKAHFRRMHCVMVDDVGNGLGSKIAPGKLLLPASALVETSPHNHQAFYFLTDDADSRRREQCELIVERMIKAGLTTDHKDPGMRGVTRFGRLPIGVNGKRYADGPHKGQLKYPADFRLRCAGWNPAARYSIGQIAAAWGLSRDALPARAPVIPIAAAEAARCGQRFDSLLKVLRMLGLYKGMNSAGWYEITCPWIHEHTDRADNGAALAPPNAENGWQGAFKCHHSHSEDLGMRTIWAFVREVDRTWRRRREG